MLTHALPRCALALRSCSTPIARVFLRAGAPSPRAQSLLLTAPTRSQSSTAAPSSTASGWMDKLKSAVTGSKTASIDKKRAELFQMSLDLLAASPTFDMRVFRGILEALADKAGLHDWRSLLRTKSQQAEVEDAWVDLKLATALTPDELDDPGLIHRRQKLRLAQDVGCEVPRVTQLLNNYEQNKSVWRWVQSRRARNLPVPATLDGYHAAMSSDKHGLSREQQKLNQPKVRSPRAAVKSGTF